MQYRSLLRGVAITTPVLLVALSATALSATAQAATAGRQAEPTAAQARSLSRGVTDKVIIVFRDQVAGLPDTPANAARRGAVVRSAQSQVLSDLAATHARDVKSFSLINAISATVSRGTAKLLAANPAVRAVLPDLPIPVADAPVKVSRPGSARASAPLPGACPAKGQVQLDPEAIENIHAATQSGAGDSAQALGYTGAGVKVAFIADGVDPDNPDFIRADGRHVFVDYQDFSGTGTDAPTSGGEGFLDSSSIAAQGRQVYNVAGFGGRLSTPCDIRVLGVAPRASLVGLNVSSGSVNFAFQLGVP
jgi:hypothetical protein